MEFFTNNTKIDFMAQRKWAALVSLGVFIASLTCLLIYRLNWGLDFTGGVQIHISFPYTTDTEVVRTALLQHQRPDIMVINYGSARDFLLTFGDKQLISAASLNPATDNPMLNNNTLQDRLLSSISAILPTAKVNEVNYIGPQVGHDLAVKALLSIILALGATMLYVAWRFEWRLALGSTLALIHDPIIILGVFAYCNLTFNLIELAAILTVIGYSLNDTIVIFDRIREDFRRFATATTIEVTNQAINKTLSRTIMTSVLTLTVVLALFIFGGQTVHNFALALIIGIIVGTYSSIYVAGSLAVWLGMKREHLLPRAKFIVDDLP